jgi:Bacterial PH domain
MVTYATVEQQLKAAGCNFRFWGRSELRELCNILLPGETIAQAVNGQYDAGFALLCATDFRVLLIDKKPKYLTLKDIRYDMITELDFSGRMLNSNVKIYTPNKELRFTTTNTTRLRKLYTHTQHKVMEIRHHFMMQQFQQQQLAANTPPGVLMAQQHMNEPLPAGNIPGYQQVLPAQAAGMSGPGAQVAGAPADPPSLYNPATEAEAEEHKRLAAFMGATGLQSIVHNGQVIKAYMTVPFQQRWRKRPYGFSRDALPPNAQQT